MRIRFIILLLLLSTELSLMAQQPVDPDIFRNAQRNVCAIKVYLPAKDVFSLGCGVVLRTEVKQGVNEYFVATAYHILSGLIEDKNASAMINVFDNNGKIYTTEEIGASNIIWTNRSMDAALLILPRNIKPEYAQPDNYVFPGFANLKLIGDPTWGQDIYLFGYRWLNENKFIDIVKKGILSVGTTELPGYEGHLVYLIDNMANMGMSGGLAFTPDGTGIGIISSYVYEPGDAFHNSDDLSVCLPLTIYFNALSSIIVSHRDHILNLLDE